MKLNLITKGIILCFLSVSLISAQNQNSNRNTGTITEPLYPGCQLNNVNFAADICFYNFMTNDLNEILKKENKNFNENRVLSLVVSIDENGGLTLNNVLNDDENRTYFNLMNNLFTRLNSQFRNNGVYITPARDKRSNRSVSTSKKLSFVIKDQGYHFLEDIKVNNEDYKVYKNQQLYYIKKEGAFKAMKIIKGEEEFNNYKKEVELANNALKAEVPQKVSKRNR